MELQGIIITWEFFMMIAWINGLIFTSWKLVRSIHWFHSLDRQAKRPLPEWHFNIGENQGITQKWRPWRSARKLHPLLPSTGANVQPSTKCKNLIKFWILVLITIVLTYQYHFWCMNTRYRKFASHFWASFLGKGVCFANAPYPHEPKSVISQLFCLEINP